MVARLTPDQKVACSIHVGFIQYLMCTLIASSKICCTLVILEHQNSMWDIHEDRVINQLVALKFIQYKVGGCLGFEGPNTHCLEHETKLYIIMPLRKSWDVC